MSYTKLGLESFSKYVSKYIDPDFTPNKIDAPFGKPIWDEETKDVLLELLQSGIPSIVLSNSIDFPNVTLQKWAIKEIDKDKSTSNRKELIKEWYSDLTNSMEGENSGQVSLDDFLNTYNDKVINKNFSKIVGGLLLLHENNYTFPYTATIDDAHLMGVNMRWGTLLDNYTLRFHRVKRDMNEIKNVIPFDSLHDNKNPFLHYCTYLGRTLHCLGLKKGDGYKNHKIPESIQGDLKTGFAGGLFDATHKGVDRIEISFSARHGYKKTLKKLIYDLADIYSDLGIELTKAGPTVEKYDGTEVKYNGFVPISQKRSNLKKIKENLYCRFPSTHEFLDNRLS